MRSIYDATPVTPGKRKRPCIGEFRPFYHTPPSFFDRPSFRPNDIELTIILHASPVLKNFPSPLPHVRRAVFVSGRILGVTTELPQLAVLDLYAVIGRELREGYRPPCYMGSEPRQSPITTAGAPLHIPTGHPLVMRRPSTNSCVFCYLRDSDAIYAVSIFDISVPIVYPLDPL
jgi:hypothetical protein